MWDIYVFVDISDVSIIGQMTDISRVREIYDHHLGYTEF